LVLCEVLRAPAVTASALATLDRVVGGRLDVGLGSGWYEPDYAALGMTMPSPGVRLARLREATEIITALLEGETLDYTGSHHRTSGAVLTPGPAQRPRPPVFLGGKGDRLLATVAACADGWNTSWIWTPDAYRERVASLERSCERLGRDPATVWRSLGLYALVGENEADLARRFDRLRDRTPPGILDGVSLDDWRVGRLVGTVEQVREQVADWVALGVETLIVCPGAVPFHVGSLEDLDPIAEAVRAR
jgi:alkanesulfonate monooxygenase SsuD/methylene tetrahydromethanopterin reductase-like flavin-dependent oxidoreductase (luciferase family)